MISPSWIIPLSVVIFILGQIMIKMIIEPIMHAKQTIALIEHKMAYYQLVYLDPGERHSDEKELEAYNCARELAAQLMAEPYMIPFYSVTAFFSRLPNIEALHAARTELIALSNNVYSESKSRRQMGLKKMKTIRHLLKLER